MVLFLFFSGIFTHLNFRIWTKKKLFLHIQMLEFEHPPLHGLNHSCAKMQFLSIFSHPLETEKISHDWTATNFFL